VRADQQQFLRYPFPVDEQSLAAPRSAFATHQASRRRGPLRARSSLYSEPWRFVQGDDVIVPVADQPPISISIAVGHGPDSCSTDPSPRLWAGGEAVHPGGQANGLAGPLDPDRLPSSFAAVRRILALISPPPRAQKLFGSAPWLQLRKMPRETSGPPEPGFASPVDDGAQFHPPALVAALLSQSTGRTSSRHKFDFPQFPPLTTPPTPLSAPPRSGSHLASAPPAVGPGETSSSGAARTGRRQRVSPCLPGPR